MDSTSLYDELVKIVGSQQISNGDHECLAVSVESTALGISFLSPFSNWFKPPKLVVKPQTTEHVVSILKLANKTKTPVVIRGGGAGGSWGTISSERGMLIDMTDMDKIVDVDEASMSVRVQAGITWGKLRHELNKYGLRPGPLGPHGIWGSTIGGALSYNSCCYDSHKYGQLSEDVLSLQVVLPRGEVIETGSRINPKSSLYHRYCNGLDLTGLFLGASGTLGVITEATLRCYPKEKYHARVTFGFKKLEASCQALHEISQLGYIDDFWMLCGEHTVKIGYPGDLKETESVVALYTTAQDQREIAAREDKWMEVARKYDAKTLDTSFADKNSPYYTGVEKATGQSFSWGVYTIWPILKIPSIHKEVEEFLKQRENIIIGDIDRKLWTIIASGGVRHPMCNHGYGFIADRSNPDIRIKAYEAWKEMQKMAVEHGAAFYDLGRLPAVNYLWEKAKPVYSLLKAIKEALDPNNILNPGCLML
ncbi:MAG: FAD-binding oxidoreductase [Candidatus Bathyarchaeia archaeon]